MLYAGLRGRACRVGASDLLFRTGSGEMFTYPDVTVICGPVEPVPGRKHVVTNPVFVAEVLSPSTEAIDRGGEVKGVPGERVIAAVCADLPGAAVGGSLNAFY